MRTVNTSGVLARQRRYRIADAGKRTVSTPPLTWPASSAICASYSNIRTNIVSSDVLWHSMWYFFSDLPRIPKHESVTRSRSAPS